MQAILWKHRTQRGAERLCVRFKGNHPDDKPSRECIALVRPCGSYRKGGKRDDPACWYINNPDQLMASLNSNSSQDPDILSLVQAVQHLGQAARQHAPIVAAAPQVVHQDAHDDAFQQDVEMEEVVEAPLIAEPSTYTAQSGVVYGDLRDLIHQQRQKRLATVARCVACEQETEMEARDPTFQSAVPHNTTSDQCWYCG